MSDPERGMAALGEPDVHFGGRERLTLVEGRHTLLVNGTVAFQQSTPETCLAASDPKSGISRRADTYVPNGIMIRVSEVRDPPQLPYFYLINMDILSNDQEGSPSSALHPCSRFSDDLRAIR